MESDFCGQPLCENREDHLDKTHLEFLNPFLCLDLYVIELYTHMFVAHKGHIINYGRGGV